MDYYNFFFYSIFTLMTIFVLFNQIYPVNDNLEKLMVYTFGILFLILFGTRDLEVGTDTLNYTEIIENIKSLNLSVMNDIGFMAVVAPIYLLTNNLKAVFFTIALMYMIPIIKLYTTMNFENRFLVFYIFVSLLSFEALGINIIRQGVAISLSLLAFNYIDEKKEMIAVILFFIAFTFHVSIILFISFYLISIFIKNPLLPFFTLIISSIISFLNIDLEPFFNLVPFFGSDYEDKILIYNELDNTDKDIYETGFRLDFFIFNWFFVIVGLLMYYFDYAKNYKFYLPILNTFMFSSSFFFLKFNQIFSDRYGVFAWVLIPFIFVPLADNKVLFGKYYTFLLCLFLIILFRLYSLI